LLQFDPRGWREKGEEALGDLLHLSFGHAREFDVQVFMDERIEQALLALAMELQIDLHDMQLRISLAIASHGVIDDPADGTGGAQCFSSLWRW
jgi:hypothetical protein